MSEANEKNVQQAAEEIGSKEQKSIETKQTVTIE